jgi:hypothetical protein
MPEDRRNYETLIAVIQEQFKNLTETNQREHDEIKASIHSINGVKADIRWLTWGLRLILTTSLGMVVWLLKLTIK